MLTKFVKNYCRIKLTKKADSLGSRIANRRHGSTIVYTATQCAGWAIVWLVGKIAKIARNRAGENSNKTRKRLTKELPIYENKPCVAVYRRV